VRVCVIDSDQLKLLHHFGWKENK